LKQLHRKAICSTSDELSDSDIHYQPVLLWRFCDSGAECKNFSLTYFLLVVSVCIWYISLFFVNQK